jgi:hypothetical protein
MAQEDEESNARQPSPAFAPLRLGVKSSFSDNF